MIVPRRLRRWLRQHVHALLLLLVVGLGLLPASVPQVLPQAVAAALPDALTSALAPMAAQAAVTGVSNFGSAVDCLTASDQFVTSCTGDTTFNPPANPNDPATAPSLIQFGKTGKVNKLALGQVGATYGLAYDDGMASGKRQIFLGAFAQRFATYGPAGPGGIYAYNLDTGALRTFAQVTNTDRHGDRRNFDREIGPWVTKSGLGDLEIGPDGTKLYAMNLETRAIEVLPIAGASARSSITLKTAMISSDLAAQADLRPFGMQFQPSSAKFLYVGVVDSAERTSAVAPKAYVVAVDVTTGDQFVALTVDLSAPAIANRFANSGSWKGIPGWYKWAFDYRTWGNPVRHPQPILSDIVFAPDGQTMLLGFRDRASDQFWSFDPVPQDDNHIVVGQGDTLAYKLQGGAWTMQTTTVDGVTSDYLNDNYVGSQNPPNHSENHSGALAWSLGSANGRIQGELVTTAITPFRGSTNGATWYQMNPSQRDRMTDSAGNPIAIELISKGAAGQGKAQRLGDLESLCTWALVGDYVWKDTNRNGVQDTGEPPIPGVKLELLNGTTVITSATTDARGTYLFAVKPGKTYTIRVATTNPPLNGLQPTGLDQGGNDATDSDFNPATGTVSVPAQLRGASTLTFDAGYVDYQSPTPTPTPCVPGSPGCSPPTPTPTPCVPGSPGCIPPYSDAYLGDFVWNDLNANGVQDTGEPGIPGVTVELLAASTGQALRTATTNTSGYYEFLVPPIDTPAYQVRVATSGANTTVLANFQRSPRDASGNDAQDSDADASGLAPAVNAPAASRTMTLDFGFSRATNVKIVKTGLSVAQRGQTFTYYLTATNTTVQAAQNVTVADTLPGEVLVVSAAPQPAGFASSVDAFGNQSTSISWNLGTLQGGETRTLQIVVKVKDDATPGATLRNLVRISTPSYGDSPGDNASTWDTTIPSQSTDVAITKAGPAEVAKDEPFTYTLSYRNDGPGAAANVAIVDTFPPTFVYESASPAPVYANNRSAQWYHAGSESNSLPNGGGGTITIRGHFTTGGSFTNRTEVRTATSETTYTNNTDQVTTVVVGQPQVNLAIDKRAPVTVEPGKTINYTILVSETTGNREAQHVLITDTLPAGVTYLSTAIMSQRGPWETRPAQAIVSVTGQQVVIDLGTVPAGYHDEIAIAVTASASAGTVINTVSVGTTTPETSYVDNTDSVPTIIQTAPTDSIGDRVFLDRTNDGSRDATTEPGIPGVTLDLYRYGQTWGGNGACAPGATSQYVRSTTTDASGSYVFTQAIPPTSTTGLGGDLVVLPAANFAADGPLAGLKLAPFNRQMGGDYNGGIAASVSPDGTCPSSGAAMYAQRRAGLPAGTLLVPWLSMRPYDPAGYLASTPYPRSMADFGLTERWNIAVSKRGPVSALAGTVFTYTLTVSNTRGMEEVATTVSDTLPAGLTFRSANPAPTRSTGQRLEWDLSLPAGSVQQIQVQVSTLATMPGQVISNRVCALVAAGEFDDTDNCDGATTTIIPRADLAVTKTGPALVTAGDLITYTLTYRNNGPDTAPQAILTDTLPTGLFFISASPAPLLSGQNLRWELGDLAAGDSGTITLTVQADPSLANATSLVNLLHGTTATTETTLTNNTDQVTTVVRNVDVSLDKAGPATAVAGGSVTYTLAYANAGPVAAKNVVVSDLVPDGLTLISATGNPQIVGNRLTWELGDLAVGASGTLTLTAQTSPDAVAGTLITNTATVTTTTPDRTPANDTDQVTTTLTTQWDLPILKTVQTDRADGKLTPGAIVSYTLTVTNTGISTAPTVVVTDHFPIAQLVLVEATPAPASVSVDGATVVWSLPALAPGTSATILLTARVRSDLSIPDGTLIFNRVRTNGPGGGLNDPPPNGSTSCVAPRCVQNPFSRVDLRIQKDDGLTQVTPGQQVTYQVSAANVGQIEAHGVVLLEAIPAGTTIITTASPGWLPTAEPGIYRYEVGDLAVGATTAAPISIKVSLPYSGNNQLVNVARVNDDGSRGPDRDPTTNTATDTDTLARACLGDRVWFDANTDGLQSSGETGIAGVLFELLNDSNAVITTTRSGSDGIYSFCNLGIGVDYRVRVETKNFAAGGALEKRTITYRDAGGDDARDSDVSPATRTSGTVRLLDTAGDLTIDVGVIPSVETTDIALVRPQEQLAPPATLSRPQQTYLPLFVR